MIGAEMTARNPKWKIYKNAGWNGLAYWLGKKKGSAFLPYEEAKKVVNAVGLVKRWSCNRQPNEQIYTEEDEEGGVRERERREEREGEREEERERRERERERDYFILML